MKSMQIFKSNEILKNPFLLFSPFLIFNIAFVLIFNHNSLRGDEGKYLNFAQNLIHGFYSPAAPNINLGVGPGYPLVLVPFVALKLPLISITLLNAVFYYLSIILLFKTLQLLVSMRIAFITSLFWAFYSNSYEYILLIYSETIMSFLITLFLFSLIRTFIYEKGGGRRFIYLSGIILGYIVLTKIIFGYVLLFMFIGSGLIWVSNRDVVNYKKGFFILMVALITTTPYLIYTYQLTNRVFFWGSNGGNNMYWMSTPFSEEFGNWYPNPRNEPDSNEVLESYLKFRNEEHIGIKNATQKLPGTDAYIKFNHQKDFEEINKYSGVEQDDAFKKIAINNIKTHPIKYIQNCISNLGRILFNFPYSYKVQTPNTLIRLPFNGLLLILMLFSLIATVINWRNILFPVKFLLFISVLYLGGSILGSAETRMFTVIVPIMLLWISYVLPKIIKINWKFKKNEIT